MPEFVKTGRKRDCCKGGSTLTFVCPIAGFVSPPVKAGFSSVGPTDRDSPPPDSTEKEEGVDENDDDDDDDDELVFLSLSERLRPLFRFGSRGESLAVPPPLPLPPPLLAPIAGETVG